MSHVITATYEGGVFKPDGALSLLPNSKVRLVIQPLEEDEENTRRLAWEGLEEIWRQSTFDSEGDRLSRDQLHERR